MSIDTYVNTVVVSDALDLLRKLPDASVDAVITDPPYGMGLDAWDVAPDIEAFTREAWRVLVDNRFFAFTITAPYDLQWRATTESAGFRFTDHVAWIKRNPGSYANGLRRTHESIFIYRKGSAKYHNTKGRYSDVKVPGVLVDAISVEGLQRYIDELWQHAKGKPIGRKPSERSHIAHARRGTTEAQDRISEYAHYTNVWSFIPENLRSRNSDVIKHASVKPSLLMERCVDLLTSPDAIIVDPFAGSGTTLVAAQKLGRRYIGCDLSPEYVAIAKRRLAQPFTLPMFAEDAR